MVLPAGTRARATYILLLLLCTTSVSAAVFVAADVPDGGDGTSWATAFNHIQDGLSAANPATNNQVWVKAGTYYENVSLRPDIRLYGGFAGTETRLSMRNPAANVTVIDGGKAGNVVVGAGNALIDGFTITNGKTTTSSGGGIYCAYISPVISNCKITGNTGNGIYCYQSSATIINCEITNNTDKGIYCYIGGNPTITDCLISRNSAVSYAGVYCNSGTPIIRRCTITGNYTTGTSSRGGGMAFVSCSSPPTVENCVITRNSSYLGGGVYCSASSPSFVNCTISDNSAETSGGNAYLLSCSPSFFNTILSFGAAPIGRVAFKNTAAEPTFAYCCFWQQDGAFAFEPESWNPSADPHNRSLDPLYTDRENSNYHLSQSSLCVDTGNQEGAPSDDRDGGMRPCNGLWDIGAYEYGSVAVEGNTVAEVKMISDGQDVRLTGALVSGVFDGFIYVEQDDHSAGIRVVWPDSVPLDRYVSVAGALETRDGIERQIRATSVSPAGMGSIRPRGMPAMSLAGADLGDEPPYMQLGKTGGCGLNNVGLLVRVWGRVVPAAGADFAITDGSGADALVVLPPGVTVPSTDRWVRVTGICSITTSSDERIPLILVRDSSDIVLLD